MSDSADHEEQAIALAEPYLPLVEVIALGYHNVPNATHAELVSEGRIALLKAASFKVP